MSPPVRVLQREERTACSGTVTEKMQAHSSLVCATLSVHLATLLAVRNDLPRMGLNWL